jgi:hypothetical protein
MVTIYVEVRHAYLGRVFATGRRVSECLSSYLLYRQPEESPLWVVDWRVYVVRHYKASGGRQKQLNSAIGNTMRQDAS